MSGMIERIEADPIAWTGRSTSSSWSSSIVSSGSCSAVRSVWTDGGLGEGLTSCELPV